MRYRLTVCGEDFKFSILFGAGECSCRNSEDMLSKILEESAQQKIECGKHFSSNTYLNVYRTHKSFDILHSFSKIHYRLYVRPQCFVALLETQVRPELSSFLWPFFLTSVWMGWGAKTLILESSRWFNKVFCNSSHLPSFLFCPLMVSLGNLLVFNTYRSFTAFEEMNVNGCIQ